MLSQKVVLTQAQKALVPAQVCNRQCKDGASDYWGGARPGESKLTKSETCVLVTRLNEERNEHTEITDFEQLLPFRCGAPIVRSLAQNTKLELGAND